MAASVRIVGSSFTIEGNLESIGVRRISDFLNDVTGTLRVANGTITVGTQPTAHVQEAYVNVSEILYVVPISEEYAGEGQSGMYVQKDQHQVIAAGSNWTIRGSIWLPPGAILENFLGTIRKHFIPLSSAKVKIGDHSETDEQVLLLSTSAFGVLFPADGT
ncbi:MAG: hypothetical protein ACP5OR_09195 [Candidatus Dormibacteria bacterium]